jgi:hypothetical protein
MNAEAKLDALIRREAGVAIDHRALNFDCASCGVDHAAELDDGPIARAIDEPSVVERDRRVDEVAAQGAEPRKRSLLVGAREFRIARHVRREDGGQLALDLSLLTHVSCLNVTKS